MGAYRELMSTRGNDDDIDIKPRSRDVTDGVERAAARGMLRAVGMGDDDWAKPQIGIASSWNEITPCNLSLDRLAKAVKNGVHAAGGYPLEFGTISVSDGISMGHDGMHFSLVSREVIADSVETVMMAERLDGSVLLAGCDKSLPGMLMAAARLDLASVFLYAGSTLPGQLEGMDGDITELDGLVDEILTYARLGSQVDSGAGIVTRMIDCRTLAEQVIETLGPLNAERRLVLEPGEPVEVAGDPRYLQRALQNLVANACRHAVDEVLICMHAEPGLVRIDVEDDGPGIPQEVRSHIFTPFARLDDSRTRSSGGYGLGLSIVHKIMRWHGGSVVVDSSQRLGGARFSLLLPRQAPTIDD